VHILGKILKRINMQMKNLYKEETLKAKDDGTGMWKMVAMADFKINITSEPSNAKLF